MSPQTAAQKTPTIYRLKGVGCQMNVYDVESGMDHVDALPKGELPRTPGKIVKAAVS